MDYIHFYSSPLGKITLASDGKYIVGLWFEKNRYYGKTIINDYREKDDLPVFQSADHWLDIYFSGHEPDFMPPLLVRETTFCKEVCDMLLMIPYGTTVTYGEIANQIAIQKNISKMAAQAIGHAVGKNPISIMIPCHRVVGKNGNLTGYGGGIQRKIKLLQLEGIDTSLFYIPEKGNAL